MKTSDVLAKAHGKILEHGWTTNWMGSERAGYCVVGAVLIAHDPNADDSTFRRVVAFVRQHRALRYIAMAAHDCSGWFWLPEWNDTVATEADVLEALSMAAKLAKGDGK